MKKEEMTIILIGVLSDFLSIRAYGLKWLVLNSQ